MGWYNIDAINRLAAPDCFINGRGSSTRIHHELQGLAVGDSIFPVPVLGMQATRLEPARLLVVRFRSASPDDFVSVLAWGLVNNVGGAMLQQPAVLAGLRRRAER